MTTTESPNSASTAQVDTIDTYLAAWNETDAAARAELVAAAIGVDLWYRDPMVEADGRDTFTAVLGAVQAQLPGHVMARTSDVDAHHDVARFNWALAAPGEPAAFAGVDLVKFDAEGRLHRIIGFSGETIG